MLICQLICQLIWYNFHINLTRSVGFYIFFIFFIIFLVFINISTVFYLFIYLVFIYWKFQNILRCFCLLLTAVCFEQSAELLVIHRIHLYTFILNKVCIITLLWPSTSKPFLFKQKLNNCFTGNFLFLFFIEELQYIGLLRRNVSFINKEHTSYSTLVSNK